MLRMAHVKARPLANCCQEWVLKFLSPAEDLSLGYTFFKVFEVRQDLLSGLSASFEI